MIYCREAHPIDGDRPKFETKVEDPVSTAERLEVARQFVKDLEITIPALLDKIDDKTGTDYAAHPDRLYLVGQDGTIAWAGGKGPQGFKPDELREAILIETGQKKPNSKDARGGDQRPGARGGRMRMLPVMMALDADQDGRVSAAEIENATKALQTLDNDKNGKLTQDELRPSRGSIGGGQSGQRRPPGGR